MLKAKLQQKLLQIEEFEGRARQDSNLVSYREQPHLLLQAAEASVLVELVARQILSSSGHNGLVGGSSPKRVGGLEVYP
jgi:hypothetical protein